MFKNTSSFSCKAGYELVGASKATCVENPAGSSAADWDSIPPICKRKLSIEFLQLIQKFYDVAALTCEPVSPPLNGKADCDEPLIMGEAKCKFSCEKGFKLVGAEVISCGD